KKFLRRLCILIAGAFLGLPSVARETVVAESAPPPPARPTGSLVIAGGGELSERIRDRFVELAGGPGAQIVIIPTASKNADKPTQQVSDYWDWKIPDHVQLLHTRDPDVANNKDFVKPLE